MQQTQELIQADDVLRKLIKKQHRVDATPEDLAFVKRQAEDTWNFYWGVRTPTTAEALEALLCVLNYSGSIAVCAMIALLQARGVSKAPV